VDLSDALSKLVGMVGRHVTVRLQPTGSGAPPVVAAFDGILVRAPDLVPGTTEDVKRRLGEVLFFQIDDAGRDNGFYITAKHFEGAAWDADVPLLTVRVAGVEIFISPDET
jgi:hypothetical protein